MRTDIFQEAKRRIDRKRMNQEVALSSRLDEIRERVPEIIRIRQKLAMTGAEVSKLILSRSTDLASGIARIERENLALQQQEKDLAISFSVSETQSTAPTVLDDNVEAMMEENCADQICLDLQESAEGVENVPTQGGMSLQEIYDQNIASVVSITCTANNGSSTGTGVIFQEEGYIVTNAHVVDGAVSLSVQLMDERVFPARLIGCDEISDLAVLFIEAENLTAATFGDSSKLRVGDTVAAIGDPLGLEFRGTYTDGIVSAINRDVNVSGRTMTLIQTNAALNSGNSGGPLINCYGQVIGINTMKIGTFTNRSGVEGIGFAIPSTIVKDVVDQLISQGYVSGRPDIGLEGDALSSFYQHYYRLPAGLYITKVEFGSDAYIKGIEKGDIIISLNDSRIISMDQLKTFLYQCEVGQVVNAVIYRDGQQHRIELKLHEDKG